MHKPKVLAAAAIVLPVILVLFFVSRPAALTPCPLQDELKSLVAGEAKDMKQWNAFREIYSFEVEGSRLDVGGRTIVFNQGYVNCVEDDGENFKCDRRDPIFSISSDGSATVLESREVTIGRRNLGVVGDIMCTSRTV